MKEKVVAGVIGITSLVGLGIYGLSQQEAETPAVKAETSQSAPETPETPEPAATSVEPTVSPAPDDDCNPNYSPCVENASYDLDCGDIGMSVRVTGSDEYGLDRDGDGYGCESY